MTAVEWLVDQLLPKVLTAEQQYHIEIAKKMERTQMSSAVGELNSPEQSQKFDEIIESKEVLEILGISIGTLQNLRNNGTVQFFKLGGKIKYRKSDILNLIK